MRGDQTKLLPLKQKRADTAWIPAKRLCERDLLPTSRVHHPEVFEYPFFNRMQSESFPYLYDSDSNVVISAPTASGKTALMELAILRNWEKGRGQTLYLAPLKALCQERREDWSRRLARVGLKCTEVTGDTSEADLQSFRKADVVLATPEKWDSVTRKGFAPISLLLIDEVHILEQETRGATLEAVVSRMKLVYNRPERGPFRIVAISATIPNIEDIAAWLGTDVILSYDSSYRPVPLTVKVLGYQKAQNQFKFEQALTFKLYGVIQRYSDQKSTLVFCQTQKGTLNAARRLVQDAGTALLASPQQQTVLSEAASRLKDKQLAEVVLCGVGYHNAGLSPEDRTVIEQLFLTGGVVVLCTTSTLAIGVNLPCHLVVVKSTMAYRGAAEGYTEYSSLEVLQMIGRAGRPQFDTTGTAVIMTEIDKLPKYESIVLAQEVIESALSKSMIEHINAEIALSSVTCEKEAVDWLKSTYFYIRARACPGYYRMRGDVEGELGGICRELMGRLESYHLIQRQQDKFTPTTLGRTVSSNCVQVDTVINFQETLHMDISAEDLLRAIASAREFEGYPSKMDQRKDLNVLNTNPGIRFRVKGAINSFEKKVFLLLQAGLAGCPLDSWELRQQVSSIGVVSRRVVNVLREYCLFHDLGKPLALTLLWGRQFAARMWDDDPLVCKQIPGIGEKLAKALSLGGITSFSDLLSADPRKIELLCGKNPPFGSNVKSFVAGIPRYVPTAEVDGGNVKVDLKTESVGQQDVNSGAVLLLTLSSGSILAYRRLTLSNQSFSFPLKSESPITLSIIISHFGNFPPSQR